MFGVSICFRDNFYSGQLTEEVKGEFTKLVGQAFIKSHGKWGHYKIMEEIPRGYRLIKALRNRKSNFDRSMRLGKGKSEPFKEALQDLDRFEEELKRNLD